MNSLFIPSSKALAANYLQMPRAYQIEGTLVQKEGKRLRVSPSDGSALLDIELLQEAPLEKGQTLQIPSHEIASIKPVQKNRLQEESKQIEASQKILEEMEVEPTEENMQSVGEMQEHSLPLNKETFERYRLLKQALLELQSNLTMEMAAQLKLQGIDIDSLSVFELQNEVQKLQKASPEANPGLLLAALRQRPALGEEERSEKAKALYGKAMGKDICDAIDALWRAGAPLERQSVDDFHDTFSKLYDLRTLAPEQIAAATKRDAYSIDALYDIKRYARVSALPGIDLSAYQKSTAIPDAPGIEPAPELAQDIGALLQEAGLTEAYRPAALELLRQGQPLTVPALLEIEEVQKALKDLIEVLDVQTAAVLIGNGKEVLGQDVRTLLAQVQTIQEAAEEAAQAFSQVQIENAQALVETLQNLAEGSPRLADLPLGKLLEQSAVGKSLQAALWASQETPRLWTLAQSTQLRCASVLAQVRELPEKAFFLGVDFPQGAKNALPREQSIPLVPVTLQQIAQRAHLQGFLTELPTSGLRPLKEDSQEIWTTEPLGALQELDAPSYRNHYRYLRQNMRASHVHAMVRQGFDPMRSDIAHMQSYVKSYETARARYEFPDANDFSVQEMAACGTFLKEEPARLPDLLSIQRLRQGQSALPGHIERLWSLAKRADLPEARHAIESAIVSLQDSAKEQPEARRQAIETAFSRLWQAERLVQESPAKEKESFEATLRSLRRDLAEEARLQEQSGQMAQIPFNMGEQGSSAHLFAKSPGKKSGHIDPQDMRVLLSLCTAGLGQVGLYLTVQGKEIAINLASSQQSTQALRTSLPALGQALEQLGYQLQEVRLQSPEEAARVRFIQENAQTPSSGLLDVTI